MDRTNWDDLRYVIAVAEEGTVSAAARRLGVNHATVVRRIAGFEATTGVEIFEKSPRGYAMASDHRAVIKAAKDVEEAILAFGRILRGARAPLSGEVRITSSDSLCVQVLPRIAARLQILAPDLRITLLSSNTIVDLARTHADITVRPAAKLPDDLTGTVAARLGFGVYRAAGPPHDPAPRWLGLAGPLLRAPVARWMADNVAPDRIGAVSDSFVTLRELAATGQGLAILPHCLGACDARLVAVAGIMPPIHSDVWVACHADLAAVPRIAQVRAALAAALTEIAPELAGPQPGA